MSDKTSTSINNRPVIGILTIPLSNWLASSDSIGIDSDQAKSYLPAAYVRWIENSGARVVVEGIGDHGCEYMTGGRAVILGETGRNFGAGMSGGIAYVYNPKGSFIKKCNDSTFELEDLVIKEDINELKELISNHYKYTKSSVAEKILLNWTKEVKNFSKVMPTDYKRVLQEMDQKKLKVS